MWLNGCCDLIYYNLVPGYQTCGWLERKRLDHAAFMSLFRSSRFRSSLLLLVAVQMVVLSFVWHWDLAGWRRDLLRAAPGLIVLPWFATARKNALGALLGDIGRSNCEEAHRQRRRQ